MKRFKPLNLPNYTSSINLHPNHPRSPPSRFFRSPTYRFYIHYYRQFIGTCNRYKPLPFYPGPNLIHSAGSGVASRLQRCIPVSMRRADYDPPGSRDRVYWLLNGFWKDCECWGRMEFAVGWGISTFPCCVWNHAGAGTYAKHRSTKLVRGLAETPRSGCCLAGPTYLWAISRVSIPTAWFR